MSLNPYSNGRYSMGRWNSLSKDWFLWVLILILMEDTLWVDWHLYDVICSRVLILILMEDTLWAQNYKELILNWLPSI